MTLSGETTSADGLLARAAGGRPTDIAELILPDHRGGSSTGGARDLGLPGPPVNRHAPFYVGFVGALGVATAILLVRAVVGAREVLVIVGVALFLAIGLDPAVVWLNRRGIPRYLSAILVVLALLGFVAGFAFAGAPPATRELHSLAVRWPEYRNELVTGHGTLGRLVQGLHLSRYVNNHTLEQLRARLAGGVFGGAKLVASAIAGALSVLALTIYFTIALPGVRRTFLEVVPRTRRDRVAALADEVFVRVGGFVLGNITTSLIAALGTFFWAIALHLPYPLLLGMFVAIFDLIPMIGSTIAGIVVSLIALSIGVPQAIGTAIFYVAYRLAEDYLITPRVMRRTVHISSGLTIIATLIGGALLGLVGALVAIPAAATVHLLLNEVVARRAARE